MRSDPGAGIRARIPSGAADRRAKSRGDSRNPDLRRDRERPLLGNHRRAVPLGDRTLRLRESELRTIEEIGTFRAIAEEDLLKHRYAGRRDSYEPRDLRSLARQGLVERQHVAIGKARERTPAVTLTTEGKQLAEQESALGNERRQEFPRRFRQAGGTRARARALPRLPSRTGTHRSRPAAPSTGSYSITNWKRDVYSALGGQQAGDDERFAELQRQVAEQHNLRVVDGKVPLPDLRIEYRDAAGASARVDVELTTEHYKSGQIAAKAQAGFALYSLAGDGSSGGTPVREGREVTAGILSV